MVHLVLSSRFEFLAKWGPAGSDDGQIGYQSHIAADKSGNVYVADVYRIQKFSSSGELLGKWSTTGYIFGIATDMSGNVYVNQYFHNPVIPLSDSQDHIEKFAPSGESLGEWSPLRSSGGSLDAPWQPQVTKALALDRLGNIYVLIEHDSQHGPLATHLRIQKFAQGN